MRAAGECAVAISPHTLRADISRWAGSLTWGDQFTAALSLWRKGAGDGDGNPVLSKDWHDDFYAAMREANGVIPAACELACIGVDLVYAVCDKRNKAYDKDFDEQVRMLEGLRMSGLRENLLAQAAVESPDGARLAAKVLENAMPSRHASRQQVDVSGKVEHDHDHQHRLAPEVVAAAQARFKTLTAGRDMRPTVNVTARLVDEVTRDERE